MIEIKDKLIAIFLSSILLTVLILASPISPFFNDEGETTISLLKGRFFVDGIEVSSSNDKNIYQAGNMLKITKSGTYRITGRLEDAQIHVDVEENDNKDSQNPVKLVLDNVEIISASMPAIDIKQDAVITLVDGSVNKISSNDSAAIYSKGSIIFEGPGKGTGRLIINSKRDGIHSESDIIFENGQYEINAGRNGVSADKDLYVNGGRIIACGLDNETINIRSGQHSMHFIFQPEKPSDIVVQINESEGKEILKFQTEIEHKSLLCSSPDMQSGQSYKVYYGNILQQHSVNYTKESNTAPRDLEDWLKTSDIPDDIRAWIITESYGQASLDFKLDGKGATYYNVQDSGMMAHDADWPFKDVSIKKWYYEGIKFSYEKGIMKGVSANTFAPGKKINRAMLVTMLHRIEGLPKPIESNQFSDVAQGKWYSEAVVWAEENNIVSGYNKNKFGPKDPVTREQLISILYRYAVYKGYDVNIESDTDILDFKDYTRIAEYAKVPMLWAYEDQLIGGRSNKTLAPKVEATRAEVSVILMRFLQNEDL